MDGKELKMHLDEYASQHGLESLTTTEIDLMTGKITYGQYLNLLYDKYCSDPTVNVPNYYKKK